MKRLPEIVPESVRVSKSMHVPKNVHMRVSVPEAWQTCWQTKPHKSKSFFARGALRSAEGVGTRKGLQTHYRRTVDRWPDDRRTDDGRQRTHDEPATSRRRSDDGNDDKPTTSRQRITDE